MEPSDHLFRRESGRMVAALTRIFGIRNLALAEDVVQEAFNRRVSPPGCTVGSRMREALKVRRYWAYRSGERMPSPSYFWSLG